MTITSATFRRYRLKGIAFNAVCALYFLFLAPFVVDTAQAVLRDPAAHATWLGVLLVSISLAETWAFPVKLRFVKQAIRERGGTIHHIFILWLFRMVVSVTVLLVIAECFGVTVAETRPMPWWLVALIPLMVIRELIFLGVFMPDTRKNGPRPNTRYARPAGRESASDVVLMIYACLGFSATWSAITRSTDLASGNAPMFVLNLCVSAVIFLGFYLSLQLPYWIEELAQATARRDLARPAMSILLALALALTSLL